MPTKPKMIDRVCEFCQEPFKAPANEIKRGNGRFCSVNCAKESRRTSVVKNCEFCGAEFTAKKAVIENGNGRFCSRSCARSKTKVPCVCIQCGAVFNLPTSTSTRKFCSIQCAAKSRKKKKPRRYTQQTLENMRLATRRHRDKQRNLPNNFGVKQWRQCLAHFNHRCAYCGYYSQNLTMDHVVPISSSKCPGTVLSNIVPACVSCNSSKLNQALSDWLVLKFGEQHAKQVLSLIQSYFNLFVLKG